MNNTPDRPEITIEDIPARFRPVCQAIGLKAGLALFEQLSGQRIYIPQVRRLLIPLTYRRIKAEFNGANHDALAVKFGYTNRQIRTIVACDIGNDAALSMKDIPPAYRPVCRVIGMAAAVKLSQAFGGLQLEIPDVRGAALRRQKHARIRAEFNGANIAALAKKYGYSRKRIGQIVKQDG
jgi:Mor family transcriptional regulator